MVLRINIVNVNFLKFGSFRNLIPDLPNVKIQYSNLKIPNPHSNDPAHI